MESRWQRIGRHAAPWLMGLLAWGVYVQGLYVTGGDVAPTEIVPISIVTEGNLSLDEYFDKTKPLPYWLAVRNDRVISFYSIVPALLNVPRVWLGKLQGDDLLPAVERYAHDTACIVTALSVVGMVYVFTGLGLSVAASAFWGAVYAFGTCVWTIGSQALWQHGPSVVFLSGAIALLLRDTRWLPLAGLLLGLAVFNRPSNVVFAVPLAVYVLLHHRPRVVAFTVWAAVPAVLMAVYSQVYWGSVLALGQGHGFAGTHAHHDIGFDHPLAPGLAGVLFSPSRGLFVYTPVFLCAVPLWAASLWRERERPIARALAIGAVLHLVLYAKWQIWWGGWTFGYRLLMEMVPALMVFLALTWQRLGAARRLGARCARLAMIALVPFGVYVQYLGAFHYDHDWNRRPVDVDTPAGKARLWDWGDTQWMRYHRQRVGAG